MATIEETLWEQLVKPKLPQGSDAAFPKAQQQALANALQKWTAQCILTRLNEMASNPKLYRNPDWQIHAHGREFLGAIRRQQVDVWLANPMCGLALAADPKHFQSRDSLKKNWKNGHNDLVAFASNFHERFPLCVIAGVIAYPEYAAVPTDLKQMESICGRSIPREKPTNAYGKFEAFALVVYDGNGDIVFPFQNELLKPSNAFAALSEKLLTRTIALH